MVASCSGQDNASETSAPNITPATAAGEGEGEGGGSGEGGVDIARAAQDPIAYLTAVALVEAHIRAAKDAVQVGEREAAGRCSPILCPKCSSRWLRSSSSSVCRRLTAS
jgi:hypothetical protein